MAGEVSRMRLIGKDVRGVARGNQGKLLLDEKRASGKELKGFEAPVSGNGWQFPVREEKTEKTCKKVRFEAPRGRPGQ